MTAAAAPSAGERPGSAWSRWLVRPEAPALVFLIALLVFLSVTAPGFLTAANLSSILTSVAVLGIIALGVNQVVLAGEIDISVGSALGLCAVASGAAAKTGGLGLALVVAIAIGTLVGGLNGFLVTRGRVPSIIVTLGMLYALRGLVLIVTGGDWVTGLPHGSRVLGLSTLAGVNVSIFVLAAVAIAVALIARSTTWGRDVYAVGGNRRAAVYAGISLRRTRWLAFTLTGALVGLASVIFFSRVGIVPTNAGSGLELQVLAAVVIGGTSISGGRGSPFAAVVGAVLIGVFLNGLVLLNVPGLWQNVVVGGLILLAVATDTLRRRLVGDQT
jgi:ribose/xylose/arabinose/galactoside ABC-type transport system permease subunit